MSQRRTVESRGNKIRKEKIIECIVGKIGNIRRSFSESPKDYWTRLEGTVKPNKFSLLSPGRSNVTCSLSFCKGFAKVVLN